MKFPHRKKPEVMQGRNTRERSGQKAPVFSYHSQRSAELGHTARRAVTDTVRIHDRPLWVKYMPSLVSLAIVGAAAVYLTTLSTNPRVSVVSDPKKPVIVQSNEVYQEAAAEMFNDSILNKSKLTIDTTVLADKMESKFPELGEVVVTIPLFGRRPLIQTQPASPKIILSGNGGSFVIDNDGVPILRAQQLASSLKDTLPVIRDDSDTTIELGKQILTSELVSFVGVLQHQFKAKDITIEEYSFPALANELHVRLAGKGYYLKFNTEADARVQVGTYIALEELLARDDKTPSEYIDLRVEERAYYK